MISIKFCFFSILKTYMSCAVVIFFYSIICVILKIWLYIMYQTLCTCIIIILVSISFFIFHHIIFTICNLIFSQPYPGYADDEYLAPVTVDWSSFSTLPRSMYIFIVIGNWRKYRNCNFREQFTNSNS